MDQIAEERAIRKGIMRSIRRFIVTFIVIGCISILACAFARYHTDIIYRMLVMVGVVIIAFGYGMLLLIQFLASIEREMAIVTTAALADLKELYFGMFTLNNNEKDE